MDPDHAAPDRALQPAAVLPDSAGREILLALAALDVTRGGVWATTTTTWQRYDRPFDGPAGTPGSAQVVGAIHVMYDTPAAHHLTVYRVEVTESAWRAGWTPVRLGDDALLYAGLTLAGCPQTAHSAAAPKRDPFKTRFMAEAAALAETPPPASPADPVPAAQPPTAEQAAPASNVVPLPSASRAA